MRPSTPQPKPPAPQWLSQAAFLVSGLAVFLGGWLAMHTSDWRKMLAYTLAAVVVAVLAQLVTRNLS